MTERNTQEITERENNTSYNTKKITVITMKPTLSDQKTQEGK